MNAFIQRVANYLANQIIVKGLAESTLFQRFAVRLQSHLDKASKITNESVQSTLDDLHKTASETTATAAAASKVNRSGPPQPPLGGVLGFFAAFGKEIQSDLGLGGNSVKKKNNM